MAGVAFGGAALGGGFALAAAGYQTSAGFAARHETTHAQQIETTKRYIAEFEDAYNNNEVSDEDWKKYLRIREKAKQTEKVYEDSINAYKEASTCRFIRKWKLKRRVRTKKMELRQSNRLLRTHYDDWKSSSSASDTSSISAEHGSPPRSRAAYSDEDDKQISGWAKDVAASGHGDDPLQREPEHPDDMATLESKDNNEMPAQRDPWCLRVLNERGYYCTSLSFSPDSDRVVSGSADGRIQIWNVPEGRVSVGPWHGHSLYIESVAFSPDGKRIVSGSHDQTLRIWDAQTGICAVGPLTGHTSTILSVAFSPDGQMVVSGSSDNTIRIWNAQTGIIIAGPLSGHTHLVKSVAFSSDSKNVVSTSDDCTIRIWDARAGVTVMGPLQYHINIRFACAVLSPDGERLLSVTKDGTINIWNAKTGALILSPAKRITPSYLRGSFAPDCSFIVSGTMGDTTLFISDVLTGENIAGPLEGHTGEVRFIALSSDGRRIASASKDDTIRIWDVDVSSCRQRLLLKEPKASSENIWGTIMGLFVPWSHFFRQ